MLPDTAPPVSDDVVPLAAEPSEPAPTEPERRRKRKPKPADDLFAAFQPEDLAGLPLLLTVQQAAKVLQMNAKSVYDLVQRGKIKSKRFGRNVRIARDSLLGWIQDPA